jgi:Dynein heavy chain C-terminal domain
VLCLGRSASRAPWRTWPTRCTMGSFQVASMHSIQCTQGCACSERPVRPCALARRLCQRPRATARGGTVARCAAGMNRIPICPVLQSGQGMQSMFGSHEWDPCSVGDGRGVGVALLRCSWPGMWARLNPATEKLLGSWMAWLCRRYQQYRAWAEHGEPAVMWLAGVPRS